MKAKKLFPDITFKKLLNKQVDMMYPVGSIYMSVNDTSPTTLFGGTWERIKDTFLLSAGDTYAGGSVGGEASHTLTVDEMPNHRHVGLGIDGVYVFGWDTGNQLGTNFDYQLEQTDQTSDRLQTGYTGGSQAHNNMPPYLTVFVWKRTA